MSVPAVSGRAAEALVDSSLDGLLLVDQKGVVRSWNWGAQTILGLSREESVGRRLADLLEHAGGVPRVAEAVQEAVDTGSSVTEIESKRPDGTVVNLVLVIRGPQGPRAGMMAVSLRDVTDQKRIEQLLFNKLWSLTGVQELLRSILTGSTDYAIIATDGQGRIKVWNEGAHLQFGHESSDCIDEDVGRFLLSPPELAARHLERAFEAALSKGRYEDEFECVSKDGRRFPSRIGVGVRRGPNGELDGYVLIGKDITEERQAADALRRKTAFVSLLQNVAEAANAAPTVERAMQVAVDEVCQATGWPVGHVYVRSGDWSAGLVPTRIWHLEEPERFDAFRRITEASTFAPGVGLPGRVLVTGKPAWIADVTKDPNFPRARAADDIGVRAGFGFPVVVGQEIVAVLEFFADREHEPDEAVLEVMSHIGTQLGRVVERSRAEADRRRSFDQLLEIDRLKELDKFKENFIRTISHELNTPITPIKVQLHLLRSPNLGTLSEAQSKALTIVDRNMERLALLVQDMLDVSRIQSGQLKVNRQRIDLASTIGDAVELFRETARQSGISLEARAPVRLELEADARRIVQVLVNFVSNALKFTPMGGSITVDATRSNGDVLVRVTDTGLGLAPEQISRLFKPFSQAHDPAVVPVRGTGLGLYICRSIIEQHGGKIGCESPGPGHGSTFWFTLPARERLALQPPATGPAEPPPANPGPGGLPPMEAQPTPRPGWGWHDRR